MIRIAFYTRISLDEEKQPYSLGAQRERLEAFCTSQYGTDWTLAKAYRDTASGTHLNRPDLQQMLADAKGGRFDTLLVFRVDRLSRRVEDLASLANALTRMGVTFRSITEPFDTSNPAGQMMLQMLAVFAEFEQRTIVERTKLGMLKKAKTGKWPGGTVPLGYQMDAEGQLVINETEAVIVRRVFELYTKAHEGSSAIAQKLNADGFRTRRGRRFGRKSVLHIIRNPFYVGRFRWQQEEFEGEHEAIIPEPIFREAQQILERRSEESPGMRLSNQSPRLLSGLVRCSKCNSAMVGVTANSRGNKFAYYACNKRLDTHDCDQDYIRADYLEGKILAEIQAVFRDEALLEEIWQTAKETLAECAPSIDAELKALTDELTGCRASLDKYFRAFEQGTMAPAACNHRVEELSSRVREIESRCEVLRETRTSLDLTEIKTDFLNEILTNLRDVVDAVPAAQKKHLLQLLVEKVLVSDQRTFEVWYRLPQFPGVRTLGDLVPPTGLEPVLPP